MGKITNHDQLLCVQMIPKEIDAKLSAGMDRLPQH